MHKKRRVCIGSWIFILAVLSGLPWFGFSVQQAGAQNGPDQRASVYRRAESFLRWNAERKVLHAPTEIHWTAANTFWYSEWDADGRRFVMADSDSGKTWPAFDHERVAQAISKLTGCATTPQALPFLKISVRPAGTIIAHLDRPCEKSPGDRWIDIARFGSEVQFTEPPLDLRKDVAIAPDGRSAFRIHDFNLFMLTLPDQQESAITQDGTLDFHHAATADLNSSDHSARWGRQPPDVIAGSWSPDSHRFFTFQVDTRAVPKSYVSMVSGVRPIALMEPQALPGDLSPPVLIPYIVDAASHRRINIPLSPIAYLFDAAQHTQWSADGRSLYMLLFARGESRVDLFCIDAETGKSERVFSESSAEFVHIAAHGWRVLADGRTLLWTSDKEGWTRLYAVDLTGKRTVTTLTTGTWNITKLVHVDEADGWAYLTAVGREADVYPYATQFYRVRVDRPTLQRLTPERMNHDVFMAPDGARFVSIDSLYDRAPVLRVRHADGRAGPVVATADINGLLAQGWTPPELVKVPSADGRFTNYGLLFKPSNFDPARRYPVVDLIYPGPGNGPIRQWGFTTDPSSNPRAIAELGFEVLLLQQSGTPLRGRQFQLAWWGDLGNLGLADHVAGIKALAAQRPEIDLTRVGVVGYSAGGDAAARAILTYPDFFRAAVSVAGSYDYRSISALWPERYQGLLRQNADGTDNYPAPTFTLASKLTGKLFLAHGGLDDNVNPVIVDRMIQALNDADKDYDLMIVPQMNHWPFEDPAFVRRLWDFLVKNVQVSSPPPAHHIEAPPWDASEAP
jgi:dipeptidyl-peptidase 4